MVVPWGKMQPTICLAVDTFHWDSVIGHFNMVSDSSSDVGEGGGVSGWPNAEDMLSGC